MGDNGRSWRGRALHRRPTVDGESSTRTEGTLKLSGDNSVEEWLAHPVGGEILREMMRQGGQRESALRLVRRLPMRRLVAMSQGRLTEEMLAAMIRQANDGSTSPREGGPEATKEGAAGVRAFRAEWRERR